MDEPNSFPQQEASYCNLSPIRDFFIQKAQSPRSTILSTNRYKLYSCYRYVFTYGDERAHYLIQNYIYRVMYNVICMKLLLEAGSPASKRFWALCNGIIITCIYIQSRCKWAVVGMVQSFVSLRTDGGLRRVNIGAGSRRWVLWGCSSCFVCICTCTRDDVNSDGRM